MKKTKSRKDPRGSSPKKAAGHRPVRTKPPAAKAVKSSQPASRKSKVSMAGKPAPPVRRKSTPEEIAHQQAMERFEHGLQLFNQNQFAKARAFFERLRANPARELAERAR